MLHGAFTPPYCPAFPAQMLGSISLCGGARSNCAHPQNMSRGKNIRGWASASCELLAAGALCALPQTGIDKRNARIHTNVFIRPPKVCLLEETPKPCRAPQLPISAPHVESHQSTGAWGR